MGLYLVQVRVDNSNVTALYEVRLEAGHIGVGGTNINFTPSSSSSEETSIVSTFETVRVRIPPVTRLTSGMVVTDDNDIIAGSLSVFPPLTVPVTLIFEDSNGEAGREVIPPGGRDAKFHFRVKDRKGFEDAEAAAKRR